MVRKADWHCTKCTAHYHGEKYCRPCQTGIHSIKYIPNKLLSLNFLTV
ncbi:putative zinc ribbon protein [Yersinia intermedia]